MANVRRKSLRYATKWIALNYQQKQKMEGSRSLQIAACVSYGTDEQQWENIVTL